MWPLLFLELSLRSLTKVNSCKGNWLHNIIQSCVQTLAASKHLCNFTKKSEKYYRLTEMNAVKGLSGSQKTINSVDCVQKFCVIMTKQNNKHNNSRLSRSATMTTTKKVIKDHDNALKTQKPRPLFVFHFSHINTPTFQVLLSSFCVTDKHNGGKVKGEQKIHSYNSPSPHLSLLSMKILSN